MYFYASNIHMCMHTVVKMTNRPIVVNATGLVRQPCHVCMAKIGEVVILSICQPLLSCHGHLTWTTPEYEG